MPKKKYQNIINGIKHIKSIARFSEIKKGKLKDLVKKNKNKKKQNNKTSMPGCKSWRQKLEH